MPKTNLSPVKLHAVLGVVFKTDTWGVAMGLLGRLEHLCELKRPHRYNLGWKRWELFYLPTSSSEIPDIRLKNDSGQEATV